eukprot:UC4_evm1s635
MPNVSAIVKVAKIVCKADNSDDINEYVYEVECFRLSAMVKLQKAGKIQLTSQFKAHLKKIIPSTTGSKQKLVIAGRNICSSTSFSEADKPPSSKNWA